MDSRNFFKIFALLLAFSLPLQGKGLNKKKHREELTCAVIIPCYYKHFPFLEPLLTAYAQQTKIPNEVIISLSEAYKIDAQAIEALRKTTWPFRLNLLTTDQRCSAGKNRNIASKHVTASLVLCQDADDLPHPQRVEVVKYVFENYDILFLVHQFIPPYWDFTECHKETLLLKKAKKMEQLFQLSACLQFGSPCFRSSILRKVSWIERHCIGEDVNFCSRVQKKFKHAAMLPHPLTKYRKEYSSDEGK